MNDSITLISIEENTINLKSERERIKTPKMFSTKQRSVLLSAIDAFGVGDIQKMMEILQNQESKKLFEYDIWTYLNPVFYEVIEDMIYNKKQWKIKK